MKKIAKSIAYMKEEMNDAHKYIMVASNAKTDGEIKVYQTAMELANTEIAHAMKWHDVIMELIDRESAILREKNIEIPKYMQYQWDQDHEWYIEEMAKLKYELELLK